MAQDTRGLAAPAEGEWPPAPDVSGLIIEDDAPVDNVFSEKQMRLLTATLYASWKPGRPFFAAANVGVFLAAKNPAIVPDVFVSLDVEPRPLTGPDRVLSYFVWEYGKVPDIVIEIVSQTENGELSDKLRAYERMRVPNYVVFDPLHRLGSDLLTTFALDGSVYTARPDARFPAEGLALTLWEGEAERFRSTWLRWTDLEGRLLPIPGRTPRAPTKRERAPTRRERAPTRRERALTRWRHVYAR